MGQDSVQGSEGLRMRMMVRVCFVCVWPFTAEYNIPDSRIKCDNNLQIYVLARVELTDNNRDDDGDE